MLFLNSCDILRVTTAQAWSGVEILLVVLVVLQKTLIDPTLIWISSTRDVITFIGYIVINTLRFLTQVLAHWIILIHVAKWGLRLLHNVLVM
jgi:hypothetical protein